MTSIRALSLLMMVACTFLAACARRAPAPAQAAPEATAEPRLEVAPRSALMDEPLTIRLSGLAPGERVTVRATMARTPEVAWQSSAVFVVDPAGRVDAGRQAPVEGSYASVDAMGLIWSMAPSSDAWESAIAGAPRLEPVHILLEAERGGEVFASMDVERLRVAPDVTRHEVRASGLAGTLFLPPGAMDAPVPGVLVLGGAEGGMREDTAALLASHGHATLALAYFGFGDLPARLERIPLEYFETALQWMADHPAIDGERLAVQGISRGGELALLLGATFPERIDAVVGHVPSGVVWPGTGSLPPAPAWTLNGEPLPRADYEIDASMQGELLRKMRAGEPITLTPMFRAALASEERVAAAEIPVERIRGPVLLISAEDDAIWPSTELAARAVARLRAHAHPHAVEHLAYEDAGHLIAAPYRPTTIAAMTLPATRMKLAFGGTPAGTAHASAASWPRVLAFLDQALQRR